MVEKDASDLYLKVPNPPIYRVSGRSAPIEAPSLTAEDTHRLAHQVMRPKDVATFEKPKQYPAGIVHVLVNGIAVVENGNHTGAKPGKAILGPGFRQ